MPGPTDHGPSGSEPEGVVIGLREIYEQIREIALQHATINAKLDTYIQMHTLQMDVLKNDVTELRQRIGDLEKRPHVNPKTLMAVIGLVIAATSVIAVVIVSIVR